MPYGNIKSVIGVSKTMVLKWLKKNNLSISKELSDSFRGKAMIGKTTFTPEEDEIIKALYLELPVKTLGKLINRSHCGITRRFEALGLVIPLEVIEERKQNSRYSKGNVPFNKGKKIADYLSPEQYERVKTTFFQSGHIPHNALPDFTEVERPDKTGKMNIMIKLPGRRKLVYKNIYVWEEHTGKPLPKGYNVVFKTDDRTNFSPENLECISNKELMLRNTVHRYPKEIVQLVQLKAAVKRQINQHEKNSNKKIIQ